MMNPMSALKSKTSIASSLRKMQSSEIQRQAENEIYCSLCKKTYQIEQYKLHSHKRKPKGNVHSLNQTQGISQKLIEKMNVKPADSFIIKYSEDHGGNSSQYNSKLLAKKAKEYQSLRSIAINQPDMKKTSHIKEKFQQNPESNEQSFHMSLNSSKMEKQKRQVPIFSTLPLPNSQSHLKLFNIKPYMFDVNESGVFQVKTDHRAMPKNMFAQLG